MVNTFVTVLNDYDFSKTAANLDRARLGKQRVEAMQIYNIIDNFDKGCTELGIELPDCGMQATHDEDPVETYHTRIAFFMKHVRAVKTKTSYKLGWFGHPAVKMWIGYKYALGLYINAHIDEWVKRGYTNNMKKYDVTPTGDSALGQVVRPWWINFHGLIASHCAALINKELARNEKEWYLHVDREAYFVDTAGDYMYYGYVWVGSLPDYIIDQILNSTVEPYPHEVADEISDAIEGNPTLN
jgi:hypothetical protein